MGNRVLIVDDAAFMRMVLKNILTRNGFEIAGEAENGIDALVKYKELKPDLVTMDLTMPQMDGIGGIKGIYGYDPKATIVMISAMGQQAMVMEAIQAGAKSFIVKPFKEEKVIGTLQKVMARKQ